MRVLIVVFLVSTAFSATLWAEDGLDCTTSIVVKTCGDIPVEDRKVKITTKDGDRSKAKTDADGKVETQICFEDIATIKVSGADPLKTNRVMVQDTTDEAVFTTITLNICQA